MARSLDADREYRKLLDESLSFNNEKVVILNAKPSTVPFVVWFIISSYFPVLTACLGPIANTIAVAGIVDKWRANSEGSLQTDPRGVYAVNVVSLIFGCISNVVLLMHFSKRVDYVRAQLINIAGWTLGGGMLLVDLIVCSQHDFTDTLHKTIGFWYATFTVVLYSGCTVLLLIHFYGYKTGRYPATFNITDSERNVMVFTFILSLWFIWGSAMFSQLLDISFGEALYYCTVVTLTIGLGDIIPQSVSGKIMTLVYSLSGVIIIGLIVALTRSIIQSSSGPIFFFYRVETARTKILKDLVASEEEMNGKASFDVIKNIRKVSIRKQRRWSVIVTLLIFVAFWLLGALVFYFAEKWNYFNCFYFCFLCLITIGFGDYAPKTGCGRAFFVVWALCAVPLMTAIISTVGDTLYSMADSLDISIVRFSAKLVSPVWVLADCLHLTSSKNEEHDVSDGGVDHEMSSVEHNKLHGDRVSSLIAADSQNNQTSHNKGQEMPKEMGKIDIAEKLKEYLGLIKWLRELSRKDSDSRLNYDEWARLFSSVDRDAEKVLEDPYFWISENSPLRYPLDEPRYMIHNVLIRLENDLGQLLQCIAQDEHHPHTNSESESHSRAS